MISRLLYLMIIGVLLFTVDGLGQNTWVKTFGGSDDEYGNSITTTKDGGYVLTGWTSSNDGDFYEISKGLEDIFVLKLNSNGDIIWKKVFGGSWSEYGYSIKTTEDGGYVLTGSSGSNDDDFIGMNKGQKDIFVIKLNSNGDIVWKKVFGGSSIDEGYSITTTTDGGYVLTGSSESNDKDFSGMNKGGKDIFILKLNSNGDIIWKKVFGGSWSEFGNSITTTEDGGYVLTGLTLSNDGDFSGMNKGQNDIFVMKLDSYGEIKWKKSFGGWYTDEGYSITTTNDSGYVVTGRSDSDDGDFSGMNKGQNDIFVIKLDSNGDIQWKKCFGGSEFDEGYSILRTGDSGYVVIGYSDSIDEDFSRMNKGENDIFVIRLNPIGDIVWKKNIGGSNSETGISITINIDGDFVLTGRTSSDNGNFKRLNKGGEDIFVIKLDKNGNLNKK